MRDYWFLHFWIKYTLLYTKVVKWRRKIYIHVEFGKKEDVDQKLGF